jgi:hypothetical protein
MVSAIAVTPTLLLLLPALAFPQEPSWGGPDRDFTTFIRHFGPPPSAPLASSTPVDTINGIPASLTETTTTDSAPLSPGATEPETTSTDSAVLSPDANGTSDSAPIVATGLAAKLTVGGATMTPVSTAMTCMSSQQDLDDAHAQSPSQRHPQPAP